VHLPARGLDVASARALVGAGRIVGVSTHTRQEAVAAARAGADYVVFGPVWPTGARPGDAPKGAAVGLDALAEVVRACAPMPVFALGGVDAERAPAAIAVGARIACIGAVLARPDVAPAARALAAAIG
jgi:thiamine-phosphate diphosphorylase